MPFDENAYGVLVSYHRVEDEEYGLEPDEFLERLSAFREALVGLLRGHSLGSGVRAIDLAHAFYVEVGDGDQTESPIAWAKRARTRLSECGFESVGVVTHGGRWVDEDDPSFVSTEYVAEAGLVTLRYPSEPFRRALAAEVSSRPDDDDSRGWGVGLYLDVEAAEALGLSPKNAPTILSAKGATFYRVTR